MAAALLFVAAALLPLGAAGPARVAATAEAAQLPRESDAREIERLSAHIAGTWKMPLPAATRIVRAAFSQARQQGVPATLILAVVARESGFRPAARSAYGAQGLMQVVARHHPDKTRGLGRHALLHPETNIEVGTRVLAEYLERDNGRVDAALRRYSGNARSYPRKVRVVWASLEKARRTDQASA